VGAWVTKALDCYSGKRPGVHRHLDQGPRVLASDAAWCASLCSGMGISGGLAGAHVLAGEINRYPTALMTSCRVLLTSKAKVACLVCGVPDFVLAE